MLTARSLNCLAGAILMMDMVTAGHYHNAITRRGPGRGHLAPHRRDNPVIWPNTAGPTSWDLQNNPSSVPSDPAIACIAYALVKSNHLWIVDLMGKAGGALPSDAVAGYSGTQAAYSIFDATYYRHQVNVTINAAAGPQWAVGYEAAYNASLTKVADLNGSEETEEGKKLRVISGYPTRKFDSGMLTDATSLGYLLNRCDETPILAKKKNGPVNIVAHANGNGTYVLWAGDTHTTVSWSLNDLYDKNKIEYYVSLADFQRWTQSAFAWQAGYTT